MNSSIKNTKKRDKKIHGSLVLLSLSSLSFLASKSFLSLCHNKHTLAHNIPSNSQLQYTINPKLKEHNIIMSLLTHFSFPKTQVLPIQKLPASQQVIIRAKTPLTSLTTYINQSSTHHCWTSSPMTIELITLPIIDLYEQ